VSIAHERYNEVEFFWRNCMNANNGLFLGLLPFKLGLTEVPVNSQIPEITGTPAVDETLTTSTGTWQKDAGTFTYQWFQDGVAMAEETAATLVLTAPDSGSSIHSEVTCTNRAGKGVATSRAVTVA
jgi:hypothetical protein